ncbi:MAG: ABC transporter [Bacteroidetes bacterium]|nr:MAG: ABC transporter [Bacteroidota bacterium]
MSEKILKALLQLFAIISRPGCDLGERERVVSSFLNKQLNREQVESYLGVFQEAFYKVRDEDAKVKKKERLLAKRSVRVLKICTALNQELDQTQKIIILFQLLEFIKSEGLGIDDQEMAFISIVSETLRISDEDFSNAQEFVLIDNKLKDDPSFLLCNEHPGPGSTKGQKHLFRENLKGEIYFIHLKQANLCFVKYLGFAELYMNGQLLEARKCYPFNTGSSLRNQQIDPVYYSDVISLYVSEQVESRIVFEASHISYKFKNGDVGLHDVDFSEQSGRLVGIMGASGAGKSTLLNVLNGSAPPSSGTVRINGIDIHSGKPEIDGIIGFVSQDDLLIEELSVYQNLYYNARLCFDHYTEDQLVETVDKMLSSLGLLEIKHIQVGSPLNKMISGGQRKRLNIALELIREPAVLFLDEPTSGLSSRDSENIMDLLKELSFKGKLVFVVIHQPSSDIFKMFDRLLILDTGGYLIYNGNPVDSIIYFKSKLGAANWNKSECPTCGNVNPEQVFNIIETSILDEFGNLTHTRRFSPEAWYEIFRNDRREVVLPEAHRKDLPENAFRVPGKLKQFGIFIKRDILKKLSDRQYLFVNLFEAPVLAFLLAFIVRYFDSDISNTLRYSLLENTNLPVYIFMAVIIAIFMGLSASAEEIIKDRKVLKREAFLNLSWSSYLLSKVAVQFLLSAIQAASFVIIGNSIMGIRGMYIEFWIVLFSSWASANLMGLLISDSFKSVVTIYILIPFLVIPQIILSGIIVKYENLNPRISSPKRIPLYGEIITARWAYEGLATYNYMENDYQKHFYHLNKLKNIANLKANFHIKELQNKLDFLKKNRSKPGMEEECAYEIAVLANEIEDDLRERKLMSSYYEATPRYGMKYLEELQEGIVNDEIIGYTREYLQSLKDFYTKTFKLAVQEINKKKEEDFELEELLELERKYSNTSLEEFVTNNKSFDYYVEVKGDLIQKRYPIYQDPVCRFIKAHFYAPRKMVFGRFIPTIWVNVMVIWTMTLILYILLYFRVLKAFLDYTERLLSRGKDQKKGCQPSSATSVL